MKSIYSALTHAANCANYNVVRYLVENDIFVVDEFDKIGQTALIEATQVEEIQMVELLLELGANKDIVDSTGITDLRVLMYFPLVSVNPGPISVRNVNVIGVTK